MTLARSKALFVNYAGLIILFIPMIIIIQNNVWPHFTGIHCPLSLGIPFLVYHALYRKAGHAVFMAYFVTFSSAATSSLPAAYLLAVNTAILLGLFLFKRIYYSSLMFFSTASAVALLFFPGAICLLFYIMTGTGYFHGFAALLGGGFVTWLFSFPLLGLLQGYDRLTIFKQKIRSQRSLLI